MEPPATSPRRARGPRRRAATAALFCSMRPGNVPRHEPAGANRESSQETDLACCHRRCHGDALVTGACHGIRGQRGGRPPARSAAAAVPASGASFSGRRGGGAGAAAVLQPVETAQGSQKCARASARADSTRRQPRDRKRQPRSQPRPGARGPRRSNRAREAPPPPALDPLSLEIRPRQDARLRSISLDDGHGSGGARRHCRRSIFVLGLGLRVSLGLSAPRVAGLPGARLVVCRRCCRRAVAGDRRYRGAGG